jgi:hypothetical protein
MVSNEERVNVTGELIEQPLPLAEAEKEAYSEQENSKGKIIDEDLDNTNVEQTEKSSFENKTEDDINLEESESISAEEMDLKRASELAKKKLSEALDKRANATISIEHQGDHWLATVEVVEEEYLPGQNLKSMNDILGVYEVKLSDTGKLLKWTRKTSYKRAEIK